MIKMKYLLLILVFPLIASCASKENYTKDEVNAAYNLIEELAPPTCGYSFAHWKTQYWCANHIQQSYLNRQQLKPRHLLRTKKTRVELIELYYDCKKKKCRFDVPEKLKKELGY